MADIRCPGCGKVNPDFFDVCQFCQTPLTPESVVQIGQKPTKKNTGELEPVLPEWLRDVRKQSKESAEEDANQMVSKPKVQKEEPADLLAGLAFQSGNDEEEEIPDWLTSINPIAKEKRSIPETPAEPANDFFAQFNKSEPAPQKEEPRAEEPSWMSGSTSQPEQTNQQDELSQWFAQAAEPQQTFEPQPDLSKVDSGWDINAFGSPASEQPAPKEEEDLGWLHSLEDDAKKTGELSGAQQAPDWLADFGAPSGPSRPAEQEDLSWLNALGGTPAPAEPAKPAKAEEDLSWLNDLGGTPAPAEPSRSQPAEDLSWLNDFGAPSEPAPSKPAKAEEDLSWLNNLGGTPVPSEPAKPASQPADDLSWLNNSDAVPPEPTGQTSVPQEDLNWLNNLGGTPLPSEPVTPVSQSSDDLSWLNDFGAAESAPAQSAQSENDLSWLNNLGGAPSEPAQPAAQSQDDLGWLNNLGASPEPEMPASVPQPPASNDLDWLSQLGGAPEQTTPEPAEDAAAALQNDLDWLSKFQAPTEPPSSAPSEPQYVEPAPELPHVSPFTPRRTAPLDDLSSEQSIPDWLKSATESPSLPLGANALDQFREDYKTPTGPDEPFSWKGFMQGATADEDQTPPSQPEPGSVLLGPFSMGRDAALISNQDIDSLFSMDMPDWLSNAEPVDNAPASEVGINAEEAGDALAPVDLPSWVQAMRPVEAVISESVPAIEDVPTEREGPLAGFRGVIPVAPIGSARRPRPVSLKLQVSDEQQASAAILEKILVGETSPRPLISSSTVASQRTLRQIVAAVVIVVLSVVIFLRTQMMQVSALLPADAREVTSVISGIPENSPVLVVLDYEPSLAGEMEAVSGPLLDQLTLLRHPVLSFVTTSPSGVALVDRLVTNTNIARSLEDGGLGYAAGTDYFNLGYLAGGEAGVLAFVQSPQAVMPSVGVGGFGDYAAIVLLTDHADSARTWIEQLESMKQANPTLASQPLLIASSAQTGPMLWPYVDSTQVNGLISGLSDAVRFEYVNNSRPGIARSYWDAFGVGLMMAVSLIVLGSLWSIFEGIRARRAEAEEG